MGFDSTIIAMVAGTRSTAVYLTEEVKTVWRSLCSFRGSSFEKAGNNTVDIGIVKKVNSTANWAAAW